MTRNELINDAGKLADALIKSSETPVQPALVGEIERFCNDLCNAPSARNRKLCAVVYTLRAGRRKLAGLKKRARQHFADSELLDVLKRSVLAIEQSRLISCKLDTENGYTHKPGKFYPANQAICAATQDALDLARAAIAKAERKE